MTTAPSLTLAEIGTLFAEYEAMLFESGGEVTPESEAVLERLGALEGEKLDAYALRLRSLEEYAKQAERRAKAARFAAEHLKARLREHMDLRGVRELRGPAYRAKLQRNGGTRRLRILVENPADLPVPFQQSITTITADTAAIRAAFPAELPDHEPVTLTVDDREVAVLEPLGYHVRIL